MVFFLIKEQDLNCFFPSFHISESDSILRQPLGALSVCELNDLHSRSFSKHIWCPACCVRREGCYGRAGTAFGARQAWVQIPDPPLAGCVTFQKWPNNNIYFFVFVYHMSNSLLWSFSFYGLGHGASGRSNNFLEDETTSQWRSQDSKPRPIWFQRHLVLICCLCHGPTT